MSVKATNALDQETIEIIKSTVPVLEEQGEKITKRFYKMLFDNHPELLHIFNHVNQKKGRQPKALASSIYTAAKYIDNLEVIVPVVKNIGHKHRSLNIKAEHYPIVGSTLLLAIKDVLGEAATDEIIDAWGKAYGVISNIFIQVEKKMYQDAENQQGGWKEYRNFVVDKKVTESDNITSFYLKPKDDGAIANFLPGQYISVKCNIPNHEYTHVRQYSLSDAPGNDYYRISVKREVGAGNTPDGIVSNYLHDQVHEGDILEITAPAGDFTLNLNSTQPVVLISGGIGLTPMISMLNSIVKYQPERKVVFIHATQNSRLHAMNSHVQSIATENENVDYYICYGSPTEKDKSAQSFDKEGRIQQKWLEEIISEIEDKDYYFCGPISFMQNINSQLNGLGVREENIHFEFFGPSVDLT